ncbi:MgtC/SapB family protein [Paenibacillus aestuarii]|uniref:MgtC/SapB family protein n=1 Tax=Paenibacillus aestuarii TaxID=516965 RepID=A0ABW0KCH3_9BACL|nr:MgtC/SapB family protein [Paenibacillus aestuarii]
MTAVNSVWHISHIEILIRLMIAVLLGGLVGMEREWHNHAAGFRTHILVCLGSTTIMLLSEYGFSEFTTEAHVSMDPARLAAQVISGIGFLGAGAIMRQGSLISGLTTAASVWVVAAIGLCVGAGFMYTASFATLIVLISLLLFNKWEKYLMRHRRSLEVNIKALDDPRVLGMITSTFGEYGIQFSQIKMKSDQEVSEGHNGKTFVQLCFSLKPYKQEQLMTALNQIVLFENVLNLDMGGGILSPQPSSLFGMLKRGRTFSEPSKSNASNRA